MINLCLLTYYCQLVAVLLQLLLYFFYINYYYNILIISIFSNIFWLFFLLIFFTSWVIDQTWSFRVILRHLIIIFLTRCVRTSWTERDFIIAVTALNQRAIIYMFAFMRAAACYFYLLIIILIMLMSSAMWVLSVIICIIFRDFDIFSLNSY